MSDSCKDLPSVFRSERQSASAGSGKTYALTSRFIALAMRHMDPTCIVALTFTRKSAGEFLGRILTRLAEAAADPKQARLLADSLEKLGGARPSQADFENLLAACAENLNRLQTGTIDAFCAAFLRAFSTESGLFSQATMLDDFHAEALRRAALTEAFAPVASDEKAFDEFAEVVKAATFGREEKSIAERVFEIAEQARHFYLDHPDASWGDAAFFGKGLARWKWDAASYEQELAKFGKLLEDAPEDVRKTMRKPLELFEHFENEIPMSPVLDQMAQAFRENGCLLGGSTLKYGRRDCVLSQSIAQSLSVLLENVLRRRLQGCCDAADAMRTLARGYEDSYRRTVRERGWLTFEDVLVLLSDGAFELDRLLCEQRLDARFRHWLFDEFQDTSVRQWKVFENLTNEAIGDEEGERTFFYVGDVKQSIYAWRGGDRTLFDEVFLRARGRICEGEPLDVSWRSGPQVIAAVNALFEDNAEGLSEVFDAAAAELFSKRLFRHHSVPPAELKPPQKSFAQLRRVPKAAADEAGGSVRGANRLTDERTFEAVFDTLRQTQPTRRGKTCASLVGRNALAAELAEYLKKRFAQEQMDVAVETELELPLAGGGMEVPAFLQILQYLAHPGDTAAEQYLKMTPLWEGFARGFDATFCDASALLIASQGVAAFARQFAAFAQSLADGRMPGFCQANLDRLEAACRAFDELGGGIDACIGFLRGKRVRLGASEKAVAVMTIHKAKGLEFDMVILPDLDDTRVATPDGLQYLTGEGDSGTVLYMPPKLICEMDRTLFENRKRLKDNAAFDAICRLYVAVTRPKQALYVIMPCAEKPSVMNRLFETAFSGVAGAQVGDETTQFGDERWWEDALPPDAPMSRKGGLSRIVSPKILASTLPAAWPSARGGDNADGADADFGTAVHAVFESLGRIEGEGVSQEALRRAVERAGVAPVLRGRVFDCLRACLTRREIVDCLRAAADEECFFEMPFCVRVGQETISGVIDRLAVRRDGEGRAVGAVIIDYKPTVADAAQKYGAQLRAYRDAVQTLWGIGAENIRLTALGYVDGRVCEL